MATALAAVEREDARACWADRFLGILEDFKFPPGGRIQAGVGTERRQRTGELRHFNLSVLVTIAFMAAVRASDDWPLVFPAASVESGGPTLMRAWSGSAEPVLCGL